MMTQTTTVTTASDRITTTGKRKNAIAAIVYDPKIKEFTINEKNWIEYFPQERHRLRILSPFVVTELQPFNSIKFKIIGGGITAQAEAARHAISKLLKILYAENAALVKKLKQNNLLTRDCRRKERDKPGQRGARALFNKKKR